MSGKSSNKTVPLKTCKRCETMFPQTHHNQTTCPTCRTKNWCSSCGCETDKSHGRGAILCLSCKVVLSHKTNTEANKDDWIECRVCGYRAKEIATHVKNVHNINPKVYGLTKCKSSADRVKGENNPGYQHGGALSPWSVNSGRTSTEITESKKKAKANAEHHIKGTSNVFRRDHYKSDEEYISSQTRNLEWFVNKYGEEEGALQHQAKTDKWINSYKKQNYSKISQELFGAVDTIYNGNTYYATKDRTEMRGYKNKEYRIRGVGVLPDYIDVDTKKIIEFDGDYWHGKMGNKERERIRDEKLKAAGFEVLHIKESDYNNDKEKTVQECIEFLTR